MTKKIKSESAAMKTLWNAVKENWEIYLLVVLSVTGIALHYIWHPEKNDVNQTLGAFQSTLLYLVLMQCVLSLHLLRKEARARRLLHALATKVEFEHLSLEDALREARSDRAIFRRVRILASTTANIQPMLMTTREIQIERCDVLLVQPNWEQPSHALSRRVTTFIDAWRDNQSAGKIKQLSIKGYNFVPLLYLVIIDDHAMILGLLTEDTTKAVRMDVDEPILITDRSVAGVRAIVKWTKWFDALDARLPIHDDFREGSSKASAQD